MASMTSSSGARSVWLVQLPIPTLGPEPIRGNVPLAGGYLKLWAEKKGLGAFYDIQVFPPAEANMLGDRALVAALAERKPWLVGFTCYVWNIERVLWIAHELKKVRPGVRIVLGGPEITADNAWVLETAAYDFAVIGEGEQTFAQLLLGLLEGETAPPVPIPGLYVPPPAGPRFDPARAPPFRTPMPDLNVLGSPYRTGILDVADEAMLLLETTRGCRFQCKFCYYPKAYDKQYYLFPEVVLAELQHASKRGAREVVLLDPTLNQRKDFAGFLRLLAEGNPGRGFRYFGELRGEGITAETAGLLREAGFTEVEVGLQSIEPEAMTRMDRKNNLRAFERGVGAMLREGIRVKVDLIVGLPGDTVAGVRRGLLYLRDGGLYSDVQVFNLAVLPGTAFRHEASDLGLRFQPRPPYYVLRTPTMDTSDMCGLLQEAQELFGVEFDAPPEPDLTPGVSGSPLRIWQVNLDDPRDRQPPGRPAQAFRLWLKSRRLGARRADAARIIRRLLTEDPFTTLQVVLDPTDVEDAMALAESVPPAALETLLGTCLEQPTYLDKYYALQPGRLAGAKRLILLLPSGMRKQLSQEWLDSVCEVATLVWHRPPIPELQASGTACN
jgi:radical SAM superfamily enzyme YgiQ (UPF0313 family)